MYRHASDLLSLRHWRPVIFLAPLRDRIDLKRENLCLYWYRGRDRRVLNRPASCGLKIIGDKSAGGRPTPQEELRNEVMTGHCAETLYLAAGEARQPNAINEGCALDRGRNTPGQLGLWFA
jgi:hypothetical protein